MEAYSKGFFIHRPVGNNAFSYEQRKNRTIYVSRFEEQDQMQLAEGLHPSFIELVDGNEKSCLGLRTFIKTSFENKNIYIFDNHNHSFYVIFKEIESKKITSGLSLIHFDQHKDMRIPSSLFNEVSTESDEFKRFFLEMGMKEKVKNAEYTKLDKAFYYTNEVLNVGNFIVPLIEEGLICEVVIVDSAYRLKEMERLSDEYENYILDIDLDFFSEDMDYISYDEKIRVIKKFLQKASLVTICTSPFFVDFLRAKRAMEDLLDWHGLKEGN